MTQYPMPRQVKSFLETHRFQVCIVGKFQDCQSVYNSICGNGHLLYSFICLEDEDWQMQISHLYTVNLIIVANSYYCDEIMKAIDLSVTCNGVPVLGYRLPLTFSARPYMSINQSWELERLILPYCMASLASKKTLPRINMRIPSIAWVEDCESNHLLIEVILDKENVKIHKCYNSMEFWETIDRYDIDLVISDINHEGESGLEIARKMHENPDLSLIPVVIWSAAACDVKADEGVWAVFSKPFKSSSIRIVAQQFTNLSRYLKMLD